MTSSDLIRWGGPAAMLGRLLFVVYAVGTSLIPEDVGESTGHALYHVLNAQRVPGCGGSGPLSLRPSERTLR